MRWIRLYKESKIATMINYMNDLEDYLQEIFDKFHISKGNKAMFRTHLHSFLHDELKFYYIDTSRDILHPCLYICINIVDDNELITQIYDSLCSIKDTIENRLDKEIKITQEGENWIVIEL